MGSLSTSIAQSSNSSSKGDYTVIDMAAATARTGRLRLTLEHQGQTLFLYVPQAAVRQGGVAAGQVVATRQRPFGVEFAASEPRRAFLLALHDGWRPELQTRAATL